MAMRRSREASAAAVLHCGRDPEAGRAGPWFIFPVVSEILNRLKHAEAERERVIRERRRLEAEADAAMAAQEREQEGK